jgi:hypothetical protein
MHVLSVKRPGQKGTQGLMERYGARLVCVRYRYDADKQKRYKTVELIVEQEQWTPPPEPEYPETPPPKPVRRVGVRVAYHESELRQKVKTAGGTWSKEEKLWRVPADRIAAFGLRSRVVKS